MTDWYMLKQILIVLLLLLQALEPSAQPNCTFPGQTPVSAIPVCGSEPFTINTPTYCGITNVPVPCPGGFSYQNTNPNFFRMACFSSGSLGFLINPSVATANYDWQLFDITSRNPFDIFTATNAFVACNWSAEPGETGASDDGTELIVCAGSGLNTYSKMPQVLQGHTYLLMVANQSASGGTYQLTITGGTASITDAIDPKMDYAMVSCDGLRITLRLNKKLCAGVLHRMVLISVSAMGRQLFRPSLPIAVRPLAVTLFLFNWHNHYQTATILSVSIMEQTIVHWWMYAIKIFLSGKPWHLR